MVGFSGILENACILIELISIYQYIFGKTGKMLYFIHKETSRNRVNNGWPGIKRMLQLEKNYVDIIPNIIVRENRRVSENVSFPRYIMLVVRNIQSSLSFTIHLKPV